MRVKAIIAYDGSRFNGFQSQKHTTNTIMHQLQNACKRVGISSKIVASGRTDAGVHATGQVIHFDVPKFWKDTKKLQSYLNSYLAPFITIKRVQPVDESFHARYSAKKRAYRYIVAKKPPSVFEAAYKSYFYLDSKKTQKALQFFIGEHDFVYFHKTGSDTKNTIRTIYKASLYERKDFFVIYIEANGFLRAQIRMIVDSLRKLSENSLSLYQLKMQIAAQKQFSTTLAPPNGLYLCRVIY